MCETCGMHGDQPQTTGGHPHEHGADHDHPHPHGDHDHGHHHHGHEHTHAHPHDHAGEHGHTHENAEDGHTHEHTHAHDHEHDHGHEHGHGHHHHHHNHENAEHFPTPRPAGPGSVPHRDGLTLLAHEGALVASWEGETAEDKGALAGRVERLAAAIAAAGGRVGQIKGSFTESATTLFSTDGGQPSLTEGGRGARVQLAAIVFSLPEEELAGLLERYGFN